MRARPILLGTLLMLSLIAPFLSPADAAPAFGSASGHGLIYPEVNNSYVGGYFSFRLRVASQDDAPRGSFEFYLTDDTPLVGVGTVFVLENINLTSLNIQYSGGNFTATITGEAEMRMTGGGTSYVTFMATAVDGVVDDFSIMITSAGDTVTYGNIGWSDTTHFAITVKLR